MIVTLDLSQPVIYKTFKENLDLVFDKLNQGIDFSIYTIDQLIIFNSLIQLSTITNWSTIDEYADILNYKKYYLPDLNTVKLIFNGMEILKNQDNLFTIDELAIDINNYNNFQFSIYSSVDKIDDISFITDLESINNG